MQVYKFGGASIATPARMQALLPIIQQADKPLAIIVSALGKTTNFLESIVAAAVQGDIVAAKNLCKELEQIHVDYVHELFPSTQASNVVQLLAPYFTEMEWALDDAGVQADDYVYDQIVCIGELLSTLIFAQYIQHQGIQNTWIDARDVIKTNEHYRNAIVDEVATEKEVQQLILPVLQDVGVCVTQGFIGSSMDNNSTTLGREGSDYSAALIAAMLPAKQVTIWKDVLGFLNADPRKFDDTIRIEKISYYEVIELTYYGAQVIHPKTIKPIQNKHIPLYVKCFLDASLEGTKIGAHEENMNYPPLIVHKGEQLLMKITTLDYSFITEDNLCRLYEIFAKHHVKINMLQNAAISFVACIDAQHFAKDALLEELKSNYDVKINNNCTILTIRHYDQACIDKLSAGKRVLLKQQTRRTYQMLYTDS